MPRARLSPLLAAGLVSACFDYGGAVDSSGALPANVGARGDGRVLGAQLPAPGAPIGAASFGVGSAGGPGGSEAGGPGGEPGGRPEPGEPSRTGGGSSGISCRKPQECFEIPNAPASIVADFTRACGTSMGTFAVGLCPTSTGPSCLGIPWPGADGGTYPMNQRTGAGYCATISGDSSDYLCRDIGGQPGGPGAPCVR